MLVDPHTIRTATLLVHEAMRRLPHGNLALPAHGYAAKPHAVVYESADRHCDWWRRENLKAQGRRRETLEIGSIREEWKHLIGRKGQPALHTTPLAAHRGVVLLLFGEIGTAVEAVQKLRPQQPSACDLLDRRLLSLARDADRRFAELITPAAEAALILEQTGFSDRQVRDRIRMAVDAVRSVSLQTIVAAEAYALPDVEFLWSLPNTVVPHLTRLKGATRPLPIVEDIAVPPEALAEFLVGAQRVLQKHAVTASLYAHAATGQLHLRPFLPPPTAEDGERLESLARDLYQAVFAVGGSISGEHGDGLARTAFIRSQYGPLYKVFQEIKDLFDPHNLLNPGKIISDDPHSTRRHFRPEAVPAPQVVDLQLTWNADELTEAAAACNGCGVCKTHVADMRMCPFHRMEAGEEASPRSKANVVRNYAGGLLTDAEFTSPDMKRLAGLCFNCKQCQLECPSNVDVPHLMIEAKAAYVSAHGLSRADWILSRAHSFGALGCAISMASNWAVNNPTARWILERLLGLARQRKLPGFARRSFLRSARRELLRAPSGDGPTKPVVYFVDHYANYHDPQLAHAFVAVLRHNGIPVHIAPGQTASGWR